MKGHFMQPFKTIDHQCDVCVVGGGMAGVAAALSAARHGARSVLVQDRPMLGGNASSECRIHICGADLHKRPHMRETGILEELRMLNLARNPGRSWHVWDLLLYETLRYQDNLELVLNCAIDEAQVDGRRVVSVRGFQPTTQRYHRIGAGTFIDCTGDGVLAPLTGARFRTGREARSEYNESLAPEQANDSCMGPSITMAFKAHDEPQPFEPPAWACRFDSCDELPEGARGHSRPTEQGYWWLEAGGVAGADTIDSREELRDELLKIALGVWDHIKNRCEHAEWAKNYTLDWLNFVLARRTSRRYIGLCVLNQNDVDASGPFEDMVAYGGWTMDDHNSKGFWAARDGEPPNWHHPAPCPYGIPYRSLVAADLDNLMCAGRCHSATHVAHSSTRVAATACVMGQAAGTAAAMATSKQITPAGMLDHMAELQQALLADDCYLPGIAQMFGPLTSAARLTASAGDPQPLRDGINRQVGDETHAWMARPGDWAMLELATPAALSQLTLIVDSEMESDPQMSHFRPVGPQLRATPGRMPRDIRIETRRDGQWSQVARITDNRQRFIRVTVDCDAEVEAIRATFERTWGGEWSHIYAMHVD
jgi:hypothetical protein